MQKVITLQNAVFWTDDSDILRIEFKNTDPSFKLEIGSVKHFISEITSLCEGKAMPFLIDLSATRGTFTVSAAKLLANSPDLQLLRVSEAYVTKTINTKLLITSYKRLYEPITPFAIFNNVKSAIKYCEEFKNTQIHGSL